MLARKDGRVGYVIFNNPERHNAMSLEMWESTVHSLDEYAKDSDVRVLQARNNRGRPFATLLNFSAHTGASVSAPS